MNVELSRRKGPASASSARGTGCCRMQTRAPARPAPWESSSQRVSSPAKAATSPECFSEGPLSKRFNGFLIFCGTQKRKFPLQCSSWAWRAKSWAAQASQQSVHLVAHSHHGGGVALDLVHHPRNPTDREEADLEQAGEALDRKSLGS